MTAGILLVVRSKDGIEVGVEWAASDGLCGWLFGQVAVAVARWWVVWPDASISRRDVGRRRRLRGCWRDGGMITERRQYSYDVPRVEERSRYMVARYFIY